MKEYNPVLKPQGTRTSKIKNGTIYVQITAEKRYNPQTKYNNDKRVLIGKMVEGSSTMMIPNDKFFDFYPEMKPILELPDHSDVLKIGAFVLFDLIMTNNGMAHLINEVYKEHSDLMKDILSYMIVKETSVMQHFTEYGFEYPIFSERVYSDNRISEILSDTRKHLHDLFLEKWNNIHNETENIYISYDSTNMNSAATGAELLEFGKSKDEGSELPQINVSIGFDQNSLTPLFYELYPGSIIDNTQCSIMVDTVKRYGYKNIGFIIDRGYFSIDNIKYFEANGYEYIIMAKIHTKFLKSAFEETKYKLRLDPERYLSEHEVQGMTVKYPFNEKDLKDHYIHIYYDDVRAAQERKVLMKKFIKYDESLEKMSEKKVTRKFEVKQYKEYYHLKFLDEYLIGYSRKEEAIKKKIDECGYFAIITSMEMSAEEALAKYRFRDTSEKLFMVDKSFLEADTLRVYSDDSMESKQMLNFMALIVRNEVYKKTTDLKLKDRKSYTIPAIIRELSKIIITRNGDGKYQLRYALTNKQKKILEQFGIKENDLKEEARKICKRYSF